MPVTHRPVRVPVPAPVAPVEDTPRRLSREQYRQWYRTVFLQSKFWKRLREKAKEALGGQCANCGVSPADLHHLHYPEDVFKTSLEHVMWLCRGCHHRTHRFSDDAKYMLKQCKQMQARRLLTVHLLRFPAVAGGGRKRKRRRHRRRRY